MLEDPLVKVINEALIFCADQSLRMAASLNDKPGFLPKTTDSPGTLETCKSDWWTSGFFPGVLWYLYEYSGDEKFKQLAHEYSLRVVDQQFVTTTHDLGFIIFCSFGNGYRITKDLSYLPVIETASNSLITRFRESTGCIRSWDYADWSKQWQYPVIIDNMMNLEMLLWAAKEFNNPLYYDIAISHANTTIKNHFRPDNSTYHVVSYDTITGEVEHKHTAQGYSHESTWARGQAWGLYGYTMMYRYTQDTIYLEQAINIADFVINHPHFPEDKIPYWDFNAPNIPNTYRDASAAAIICSALIQLSEYVGKDLADSYLSVAEIQIRTLNSPQYRVSSGAYSNFLLKHSVGHMPAGTEVNVPLIYADYYFVEALMRFRKLKGYD